MTTTIKRGDRVKVYQQPITLENFEDYATVIEVSNSNLENDPNGNPIMRCTVQFDDEKDTHFRWVSERA